MSEVVPLPSFGEVFFDARGQERCLRVTWHEGTLVLSLWRGEMCTASFRMPMEDVGRLLDTLDDGFAEATGEQPAVPAHDPGTTEVMPGTGTYHRPAQHVQTQPQHGQQQPHLDERPAAALSPNDVLVARGTPAHQDKLVASYGEPSPAREPAYGETTAPREPAYGDPREPAYGEQPSYGEQPAYGDSREPVYGETRDYSEAMRDTAAAYGEQRSPFTGPQYVESTAPQQKYTGDPFSGPQYASDPLSGPHYTQPPGQAEPFTGPQYVESEPFYQLPGTAEQPRRQSPVSTDPLGFPSQAAEPYQQQAPAADYPSDPYGGRRADTYQQPQPQPQPQPQSQSQQSTAGLGTPMHGIPGAGRPRSMPQKRQQPQAVQDDYGSYQSQQPANPVDPLLALGRQEQQYQPQPEQHYQPQTDQQYQPQTDQQYQAEQYPDSGLPRTYAGDPMFSTGERLRPEQPDYHERSDRREW